MINGEEIPQQIMEEIHKKSEELTYDFIWEKRDLIMLDNKRFFHGRRPFEKGDPRDIAKSLLGKGLDFLRGSIWKAKFNISKRNPPP